jgi:gliding motility-associated-like protein
MMSKRYIIFIFLASFSPSFSQDCIVSILQKDTSVCPGSLIKLNSALATNNLSCNTYGLNTSLQNGLLGWFPFCGNTDDIGPQHNNATAYGPLTYGPDRYNNPNAAIYFTGNGESVHTNKIERTTINSFSYVTWVNTANSVVLPLETLDPLEGFRVDLSSTCVIHATHGYNWVIDHNNTGAGLFVATNGVFVLEHTDVIVPTPLVWQGNLVGWHAVAIVYDNHLPKLYIDGKFIKSGLVTPYIVHPSFGCDSFLINGRYAYITSGFGKGFNPSGATVPSNNFKGAIDDIKIYNRALADAEILELYQKDIYRLLWSTGDTTHQISVNPTQSTKYWVNATDGQVSCSDTVDITVITPPLISFGKDTAVCTGDSLVLNAPEMPGYSYLWQDGSTGNLYDVKNGGLYSIKVSDQFGCSSSDTINVSFKTAPSFSLGADTILCGHQVLKLSPSLPGGSYLWSTGSNSPSISISAAGVYWLQVSNQGCARRDSIDVTIKPVPAINLGQDTVLCKGQTLLLDAANVNATYQWQDGSTAADYLVSKSGDYTVKVTANGCDTSGSIKVDYTQKPQVYLAKDTTLCVTQTLTLNASYPLSDYSWQDGSANSTYFVDKAGTYIVEVSNICGITRDSSVISFENCQCKFYLPSAFTPDNNGVNDYFKPIPQCVYSNYEMKIFNRWGHLVFVSNQTQPGWDGKMDAHPQPPDTYVWYLSYRDGLTGKYVQKKGTVVLVR